MQTPMTFAVTGSDSVHTEIAFTSCSGNVAAWLDECACSVLAGGTTSLMERTRDLSKAILERGISEAESDPA